MSYTIVGVLDAIGSSSFLGASVDAWIPSRARGCAAQSRLADERQRSMVHDLRAARRQRRGARRAARPRRAADLAQRYPEIWRERRLLTSAATVLTGSATRRRGDARRHPGRAGTADSRHGGVECRRRVPGARGGGAEAGRDSPGHRIGQGRHRAASSHRRCDSRTGRRGAGAGGLRLAGRASHRHRRAADARASTRAAAERDAGRRPRDAGALAGMALAAAPALWAARVELSAAMRDGRHARQRRARPRPHAAAARLRPGVPGARAHGRRRCGSRRASTRCERPTSGSTRDRLVAMDFDLEPASTPPAEMARARA